MELSDYTIEELVKHVLETNGGLVEFIELCDEDEIRGALGDPLDITDFDSDDLEKELKRKEPDLLLKECSNKAYLYEGWLRDLMVSRAKTSCGERAFELFLELMDKKGELEALKAMEGIKL